MLISEDFLPSTLGDVNFIRFHFIRLKIFSLLSCCSIQDIYTSGQLYFFFSFIAKS